MKPMTSPVEKRAWYYKQEKVKNVRLAHLRNDLMRGLAIILPVIAIILIIADRLGRADLFLIHEIEYRGEFTYVDQDIVDEATKSVLKGNFFTVDLRVIQNELLVIPWIESAYVGREWPNKIIVTFDEYEPTMRWANGGLVMEDGQLVESSIEGLPNAEELRSLPVLDGKQESLPEMVTRYAAWRYEISSFGMDIEKMLLSDSNAWTLSLRNVEGELFELRLGSMGPNVRFEQFLRLLSQGEDYFKRLEYVDARYPNGVVVKRKRIEEAEQIESKEVKQTGETDA